MFLIYLVDIKAFCYQHLMESACLTIMYSVKVVIVWKQTKTEMLLLHIAGHVIYHFMLVVCSNNTGALSDLLCHLLPSSLVTCNFVEWCSS